MAKHATQGNLCEQDHLCPNCIAGVAPCLDLFFFPGCGLVACATEDDGSCASS